VALRFHNKLSGISYKLLIAKKMNKEYLVRQGRVVRTVEYVDQDGIIEFTCDFADSAILELSPKGDLMKYRKAALAARDFIQSQIHEKVSFWPKNLSDDLDLH
jgi:hypothetical protein